MGSRAKGDYAGRSVRSENGQETVYYDPTEAVEEHAANAASMRRIGGISVDGGQVLEQDAQGRTEANSSGRVIAVPKRGQEETFAQLSFPLALPVSAKDADGAMAHARRYLHRAGLRPRDFLSFDLTTHYYITPLGAKRECGWSFSFKSQPFELYSPFERR